MDQLFEKMNSSGYQLVKKSEFTQTYRFDDKFYKIYVGNDVQQRFNVENEFYTKYSSRYIPRYIGTDQMLSHPVLVTKFIPEHGLAFLSDEETGSLEVTDFENIYNALYAIQNQASIGFIVHNDFAPHNIYLDGRKVVISDWDQYRVSSDSRYRMYDFATLWYWLYVNENRMAEVYKKHIKQFLIHEGLFESFKYCYSNICTIAKNTGEAHLQRGTSLRDTIFASFL